MSTLRRCSVDAEVRAAGGAACQIGKVIFAISANSQPQDLIYYRRNLEQVPPARVSVGLSVQNENENQKGKSKIMAIANLLGKPYALRFDEEEVASANPRCGSLLYTKIYYTFLAALVLPCSVLLAEDWPGDGVFNATDATSFVNPAGPDIPFRFGTGLLLYTGSNAVVNRDLSFKPTIEAATVRVVEKDSTLEVAGKFDVSSGVLIKDGPGTLKVSGSGSQALGLGSPDLGKLGRQLMWSDRGACTNFGFGTFNVNDGRMIIGAPGQTNLVKGMAMIGMTSDKDACLDIAGGRTEFTENRLVVGCYTKKSSSKLTVTDGSDVHANKLILNMGSGGTRTANAVVDGSSMTTKDVDIGAGAGDAFIEVRNGSAFSSVNETMDPESGLRIGTSEAAIGHFLASDSVVTASIVSVFNGSSLALTNSAFLFDRTPQSRTVNNRYQGEVNGNVFVDNAFIGPCNRFTMQNWFDHSRGGIVIGSNGLTLDAPRFSLLGAQAKIGGAGAVVTKKGAGVLSLGPTAVPVNVNEGTLRMSIAPQSKTNDLNGVIENASKTRLEVSGGMSLADMQVNSDRVKFDASGMERFRNWICMNWARLRSDGVLQLTDSIGGKVGNATLNGLIDIGRSFELVFDYFDYTGNCDRTADILSFYFHKNPSGAANDGSGYLGGNQFVPSFGVGIDHYNFQMKFSTTGQSWTSETAKMNAFMPTFHGEWEERRQCRMVYDSTAHKVTVYILFPGGQIGVWDQDADLAGILGQGSAYLGFGAGTGGSNGSFSVANLRILYGNERPAAIRVGGRKALASAEKFTAILNGSERQNGFVMNSLTYADGATLVVSNTTEGVACAAANELTTKDRNMWENPVGGAAWLSASEVRTSTSGTSGSVVSKEYFPVLGDWRLSFVLDLGATSTVPADLFRFSLQSYDNKGFSVELRYYEDNVVVDGVAKNVRTTQIKPYVNGELIEGQRIIDTSPVDVVKYGPVSVSSVYDDIEKTVTLTLSQQNGERKYTHVLTGMDMRTIFGNVASARVKFAGQVGGYYAENIVRDAVYEAASICSSRENAKHGYIAFTHLNGSGTLVKEGPGNLGLVDPSNGSDVALRVREGKLLLKKESNEPLDISTPGDWTFTNDKGLFFYPNGFQFGEEKSGHVSTVTCRRKVRVDGSWRCSFSLWVNDGSPADAISFFVHNDQKADCFVGTGTQNAGYGGAQKSFATAWYFYPSGGNKDCLTIGLNGTLDWEGKKWSHAPLSLRGNTTDVTLAYDYARKSIAIEMKQGENRVEKTYENVDIPACVEDDHAWISFGLGCGGAQATPRVTNLIFTPLETADIMSDKRYLKSVVFDGNAEVLLDARVAGTKFLIADAVTLSDGQPMNIKAIDAESTLSVGRLSLGKDSVLIGEGQVTVESNELVGDCSSIRMDGVVFSPSSEDCVSGKFKESVLYLAHGAKIKIPAGCVMCLGKVYVDGVRQHSGVWNRGNCSWITADSLGSVSTARGLCLVVR